ncbi:MAG TPA: hypothetical protein VJZ71_18805 [Phycisphaerae bacterium]|nr:hypothetical protein [Phycisphaerae bacterium]
MKKNLMLVVVCLPLLATACPGVTPIPSIGVPCSNNLDASSFGFKLTIPPDFTCTTVLPNDQLLVSVRYRQNSTGYIAAVVLAPPGANTGCDEDCNTNGVIDSTEIAGNPSLDTNNNGRLDSCDNVGAPTCQEQNSITTGENITFRTFRIASTNPAFITYLASANLSNGNGLGISMSALSTTDDPSLQTTLATILETVEFTP